MFIGTDYRYRCNFKYCKPDPDGCCRMDVFNHSVDHWRRPCHPVLRLNADLIRSKDGFDFSPQRLKRCGADPSSAPHALEREIMLNNLLDLFLTLLYSSTTSTFGQIMWSILVIISLFILLRKSFNL